MTEKELGERLAKLREGMKLFDSRINVNCLTGDVTIRDKQIEVLNGMLELLGDLNWQIRFNSYKELIYDESPVIYKTGCGTPVKIRPCKSEYGDKTYFGIHLGDFALSIRHRIDAQGDLHAAHSMHNPAIFVPELNDIIYGCESWWSEIDTPEELQKAITDEVINNVWYMKLLTQLNHPDPVTLPTLSYTVDVHYDDDAKVWVGTSDAGIVTESATYDQLLKQAWLIAEDLGLVNEQGLNPEGQKVKLLFVQESYNQKEGNDLH